MARRLAAPGGVACDKRRKGALQAERWAKPPALGLPVEHGLWGKRVVRVVHTQLIQSCGLTANEIPHGCLVSKRVVVGMIQPARVVYSQHYVAEWNVTHTVDGYGVWSVELHGEAGAREDGIGARTWVHGGAQYARMTRRRRVGRFIRASGSLRKTPTLSSVLRLK